MNVPSDNPFEPGFDCDDATQSSQNTSAFQGRHSLALLLTVVGAPIGVIICSVGYLGIVLFLESACVPPLRSPANYGQFGFLLIYFGVCGLFYGASFGLLPYTRFALWLPTFLAISCWVVSGELAMNFDAAEVTCTAMILIGFLIITLAAMTSAALRKFEIRLNGT